MKKSFGKKLLAGIVTASMILGIPVAGYSQEEDLSQLVIAQEQTAEVTQEVLAGAGEVEVAAVETPAEVAAVEETEVVSEVVAEVQEDFAEDTLAEEEEEFLIAADEEPEDLEEFPEDGILLETEAEEETLEAADGEIEVDTFEALRDNINTAPDGTTLSVTADITFTEALSFDKGATALTLKLNGKTLTLVDDAEKVFSVKSGRTLTIKNGTIKTKKAKVAADGGTLILSEGTIIEGEGAECLSVENGGTANVKGEISSASALTKGVVVRKGTLNFEGTVKIKSTGIELVNAEALVAMNGGNIETSGIGVDVLKGSMIMTDGTITSTGSRGVDVGYNSSMEEPASFSILKGKITSKDQAVCVFKKGKLTVSGSKSGDTYTTRLVSSDNYAITESTGDYNSSINITGGYFEGKTEEFSCIHLKNIVTVTSDAVGFAHEVDREYLKDVNCRADKTDTVGVYVIRVLTAANAAAAYIRDGMTFYTDTVQEAMTKIDYKDYSPKSGDTVILLQDINTTSDKEILVEMGRTIDLNQHTLFTKMTVKNAAVTIKNGTLQAFTNDKALVVDAGADVTLESTLTVNSPGDCAIHVGDVASETYNLTVKCQVTGKNYAAYIEKGKSTITFDSAKLTSTDSYTGSCVRVGIDAKDAKVTINKTMITGAQGLQVLAGECTITDSVITGKGDQNGDPAPGTTLNGSAVAFAKDATLTIKSGTFTSEKGHALYIEEDATGAVVSGGTFRSKRSNWDAVAGKKATNMIKGGNFSPNKTNVMKDSVDTSEVALVGETDGIFYADAYDKVMSTLYAANASATKFTVGAAATGKIITDCQAHTEFLNKSGVDVSLLIGTDASVAKNKGTLPSTATTEPWIFHNDLIKLTAAANKEATCTLPGVTADCWYCETLKKAYKTADAKEEVDPGTITAQAKGHTWGEWDANGDRVCTVCGEKEHDDSKIQPPAPVYQISGRPTKVAAKAPGGRKLTVSWKKPASSKLKKIKGFYIEVATDKNFTNIVRHRKVAKTKTSYTFKKLKKGTRYYVRVRFYKGSKISKWSAVKYRKVK